MILGLTSSFQAIHGRAARGKEYELFFIDQSRCRLFDLPGLGIGENLFDGLLNVTEIELGLFTRSSKLKDRILNVFHSIAPSIYITGAYQPPTAFETAQDASLYLNRVEVLYVS